MQDAMTVWDSICHLQWIKQTSTVRQVACDFESPSHVSLHQIFFLNMDDLFQMKTINSDIKNFFLVSYFPVTDCSYSMYFRTMRVNQGMQKLDENTSGNASCGSLTKLDVLKNEKSTSSMNFFLFTEDAALTH
jgi:hypothetical protein